MQVPYAKKWHGEIAELRKIALACGLAEQCKWGKPCFTLLGKNVAIVIPLKETVAFSFFKGALLRDPNHLLEKAGEQTQAGRWIKFTSLAEITTLRSPLQRYLHEAIDLEKSGAKVALRKPSEYTLPEELQALLDDDPALQSSFNALTPGRKRSYVLHIAGAKQPSTRAARAARCIPLIQSGRGFNERSASSPDPSSGGRE